MCTAPLVHGSTSGEAMGKVNLRTLEQLCDGGEAESVLIQPYNFQMEEKSQKCNLCATRCSSYMHFERVGAIMGMRTRNFTNKASQEEKPNQKSPNDGILLPRSLNCARECGRHISSEASNIFSVSSHESISEIAESQATVGVSDPCEDSRKSLSVGESSDTPHGSIKFDNDIFSNHVEKHKGFDILVNNVSCIRGSDSTYLTIDENENHDDIQNFIQHPPLKGVVYPSFFTRAIPQKGECFECLGEQEGSTPARVAISGFNGQIDGVYSYCTFWKDHLHLNTEDSDIETELHLYFKKHFEKCPAVIENTSMKGQCQPEDIMDSSNLTEEEVRVCDICGDVGLEELLAICSKCTDGAEHIYCMRIKLDKVPKGDWTCEECIVRTDAKKPAHDKVKETTGKLTGLPQCQRFGSAVNIECRSSLKIKSRSPCAGGKGTNDVNSVSLLPAKRHGALSQAQSVKKAKTTLTALQRSSKPCNNSLLHRDTSFKNLKKELKETKEITSVLQVSCNASEKGKVPNARGVKRCVEALEAESDRQTRDLETEVISPKKSNTNKPLLQRDTSFNLKRGQIKASKQISSEPQISCNAQEKAEVPSATGDKSHVELLEAESDKMKRDLETRVKSPKESKTINNPALHSGSSFKDLKKGSLLKSRSSNVADLKLKGQLPKNLKLKGELTKGGSLQKLTVVRNPNIQDKKGQKDSRLLSKSLSFNNVRSDKLNTPSSEVLLPNADHSEVLKKLDQSKETQMVKQKRASGLQNPLLGSTVSDPGVTTLRSKKESLPSDDAFISESSSHKHASVKSCGLLDNSLDPSSNITHKPASDEGSYRRNLPQFDAAFFSQAGVIPEPDCIWLGKFQLYSREGLESFCDGIQAHLSTFASPEVLEAVDKLPEIIILEQLPRLRTWPVQFVERQATKENITLYFFATDLDSYRTHYSRLLEGMTKNDLALRGNLDGVELLIFPSSLLPEETHRWNNLLFLWGVFRGLKVGNSVRLSNSLKEKNRYSERTLPLDLNAYPQDGEDTEGVDEGSKCWSIKNSPGEIYTSDSPGTKSSGGGMFLGRDGYSSHLTGVMQANDKREIKPPDVDLDLSLWPKGDGVGLSTGVGDDRNDEEVHEEPTMDGMGASLSGSHAQNLETGEETKELLIERQAADTLILLSKGFGKI
ncbi:uncharacterized protein LOC114722423 isoform X2 [Neltuma alba]|uniref:uncharacterized protein LOC114722423 isoform X2 n=1 Tax=Neltuma alba TaxID=207710 RepID=UPI0010A5075C|nr:uncharacterized protein LOC114722423 isoform X2 [Prosopis alba]